MGTNEDTILEKRQILSTPASHTVSFLFPACSENSFYKIVCPSYVSVQEIVQTAKDMEKVHRALLS